MQLRVVGGEPFNLFFEAQDLLLAILEKEASCLASRCWSLTCVRWSLHKEYLRTLWSHPPQAHWPKSFCRAQYSAWRTLFDLAIRLPYIVTVALAT